MDYTDTIKLLRECDSGTKMAVSSIDEVLESVNDDELKTILSQSKTEHTELGNTIHALLEQNNGGQKEPTVFAKGMSWMKTNMKLAMEKSDATVADLITDGCNMGVKSLSKYLNQYKAADGISKGICSRLIDIEQQLATNMRAYL